MLGFHRNNDSKELATLQHTLKKWAFETVYPSTSSKLNFSREHFRQMGELGLTGASLSSDRGGSEQDPLTVATIIFELSRAQLGPAIYLSVHLMVAKLIERFDSNKNFNELLTELASGKKLAAFCLTEATAGSDAKALKTSAKLAGNEIPINGEKIYITSAGEADVYLVFVKSAEGITAVVVEMDAPGISFGKPENKMGCEGSPIATVKFDNCKIKKTSVLGNFGDGYKIALSGLAGGRVNIAAAACGISSRALELSTKFASERKQFDSKVIEFQMIKSMFADMAIKLEASILLTREAANNLSSPNANPDEINFHAAMAECFATDSAMQITTDAVQIFGGAGYIADYEVERLMRDAKMLQIVEGTNQIQRLVIAKRLEWVAQ